MASTTFRDSINSLGWSRRDPDLPVSTSATSTPILSRLQSLNPFGDRGYVRLPTQEEGPGAPLPAPSRREEEEGFFACESSSALALPTAHCPQLSVSAESGCPRTSNMVVTVGVPACPFLSHASGHAASRVASSASSCDCCQTTCC